MSDDDRLLTDAEIEAYDREIQAAGSANCWTGTVGSIAAHARRLVKTVRVERQTVVALQRRLDQRVHPKAIECKQLEQQLEEAKASIVAVARERDEARRDCRTLEKERESARARASDFAASCDRVNERYDLVAAQRDRLLRHLGHEKCPFCLGFGEILPRQGRPRRCLPCDGLGHVAKPAKPATPPPTAPGPDCKVCDGSGLQRRGQGNLWNVRPCPQCRPPSFPRKPVTANPGEAFAAVLHPAPGQVRTLPAGWNVHARPRFEPPRLIGFTGPAGCGKDLAASLIPGAVRVGFADALYAGLAAMLGVPEAELRDRSRKEQPLDGGFPSPRRLLQTLGTEWGRGCVSPDLWVTLAMRRWEEAWKGAVTIVVPDVRFQNEAEAIRAHGGQVWHIFRNVPPIAAGHVSEAGVPQDLIDREIGNAGTVADLRSNVLEAYVQAALAPSGGTAQTSTDAG